MKTFIADIIPKIQRFSQKLDDLTKLTNKHWVSLRDINQTKQVYIFRSNNHLLISDNGIVEKGFWEYLGNQSLLLEIKTESYLLKHGFMDENILALKIDSSNEYAFFIKETNYNRELNSISDILFFLENTYLLNSQGASKPKQQINLNTKYGYQILQKSIEYSLTLGKHWRCKLQFNSGIIGYVYFGCLTGNYFYLNNYGKNYCKNFEDAAFKVHQYLIEQNYR